MSVEAVLLFLAQVIVFGFYLLLHSFYLFLLGASLYTSRIQPRRARLLVPRELLNSVSTPPVTLLVAAFNERATIVENVRALLGLHYPRLEVIVVNDGSTDGTLEELVRSFSLRRDDLFCRPQLPSEPVRGLYVSLVDSRLVVVDKERGGKSDALNAGLNLCRTPWVCTVDADSVLEEEALLRALRPAIEDEQVVATSGIVRIANGCRVAGGRVLEVGLPSKPLVVFQVVEYLRGFLQGRFGWSWANGLLIISGAFGVFRTELLRRVGGYRRDTVAEDMDIVVRLHEYLRARGHRYRVLFVPDPVCWTEVPSTFRLLARQRRRWQRGLAEVLWRHRRLFFHPRMGLLGWLALPYFFLELVAPVIEILGLVLIPLLWWLGLISETLLVFFVVLAFLLGATFSLWAVLLEEFTARRYTSWKELITLSFYASFEHMGFHQLVLWWRLRGLVDFLRGRREWGKQTRVGFRPGTRAALASRQ